MSTSNKKRCSFTFNQKLYFAAFFTLIFSPNCDKKLYALILPKKIKIAYHGVWFALDSRDLNSTTESIL